MSEKRLLKIVPPEPGVSGHTRTAGTKVLTADGAEIHGVTRIEIVADTNDIWRATIHCFVHAPQLQGVVPTFVAVRPVAWWRRVLMQLAGVPLDVTVLSDTSSKYGKA